MSSIVEGGVAAWKAQRTAENTIFEDVYTSGVPKDMIEVLCLQKADAAGILDRALGKTGRVALEDVEGWYDEATFRVLKALKLHYGSAMIVFDDREVWILHADFKPSWVLRSMTARDVFRSIGTNLTVWSWSDARYFLQIVQTRCTAESVVQAWLNPVEVDGDVRAVPAYMMNGSDAEEHKFENCPSFGDSVAVNEELLLDEGVVVDLLGKRYRVWYDYTGHIDQNGWGGNCVYRGERVIRVQRTEDPVTPSMGGGALLRGFGRSTPYRGARPLGDKPLYCLMRLTVRGASFQTCVMVQLDDAGEIELAWIQGGM